jgi:hypothetical protein
MVPTLKSAVTVALPELVEPILFGWHIQHRGAGSATVSFLV